VTTRTVTIPARKVLQPINNVILTVPIIDELKKAGIPIVGHISILAVEWGSLTIETRGDSIIYTHTGTAPALAKPFDEDDEL
jgi:hypothetical protein